MANKIDVKLILQLHQEGMSQNAISRSRHISKHSIGEVIKLAQNRGIIYEAIKDKPDDEVYAMFYPDKYQFTNMYEPVDYEYVHDELKRTGVTLKLLWEEYGDHCNSAGVLPMGYRRYCEGYQSYIVKNDLTSHIEHKPGAACEVDWSGKTMQYIDSSTGEEIKVYLFVGCLPFSQYAYVEPTIDMKMDTWIRCHVNMYEYFKGVPSRTVCDNLRTGVVAHPKEGDIILTEDYEALGMYYVTAIMPGRVKKPKDKASVEGTVGKIATAIIAKLRNEEFRSFEELKTAVNKKLVEFNEEKFQKRPGSRTLIHKEEIEYLRPLPAHPYEIATWDRGHKVGLNYHVIYKKNYYSVPHQYIKQTADLRITEYSVEIYVNGTRVATHDRFPLYVEYKYSTKEEHMPPQHQKQEWDDARIRKWADTIGPNTRTVIDRVFGSYQIKEQGYNPSLSILRLSKKYSQERLETACEVALTKYRSPRYRHLNALIVANQDKLWLEKKSIEHSAEKDDHGYLRGSDYYGGKSK